MSGELLKLTTTTEGNSSWAIFDQTSPALDGERNPLPIVNRLSGRSAVRLWRRDGELDESFENFPCRGGWNVDGKGAEVLDAIIRSEHGP